MRLEANKISFRYTEGGRKILEQVSLAIAEGERVGLAAPSGFGKTTLCKILAGYERPEAGEVLLDKSPIADLRGYIPVQMIFQHPELSVNPRRKLKTVLEEGDFPPEQPEFRKRIIEELGIKEEWLERYPVEVSGGELQRFCIARALGRGTRILLADEITTMLDLITQKEIWGFLLAETARRGIGMLVVSHSEALLRETCTRVVRLDK